MWLILFIDTEASSGDEFIKDNDGEQIIERKTVTLLTGPPGSGKTAAVYAIAEEIGYNVRHIFTCFLIYTGY